MKISEVIANMLKIHGSFGDIDVALACQKSGEFLLYLGFEVASIEFSGSGENDMGQPVCAFIESSIANESYKPSGLRIVK